MDYRHPITGNLTFGASGDVFYRSSYLLDQDIKYISQPGFAMVNATVKVLDPKGGWELDLIGTNLFNKFYWEQLGADSLPGTPPVSGRVGTPGRPREWTVSFTKNF